MDRHFAFGVISFLMIILFSFCIVLNSLYKDAEGEGEISEIQIEESLTAPDRNHKATLWNETGGRVAGWCIKYISIGGENISSKTQIESNGRVFSLNCSSEVEFNWIDNSQLEIKYKFVEKYEKLFLQNNSSEDGKVNIRYIKKR